MQAQWVAGLQVARRDEAARPLSENTKSIRPLPGPC